jgi:hypothetical protein
MTTDPLLIALRKQGEAHLETLRAGMYCHVPRIRDKHLANAAQATREALEALARPDTYVPPAPQSEPSADTILTCSLARFTP